MKKAFILYLALLFIKLTLAQNMFLNYYYSINEPFVNSALNGKYNYFQNIIISSFSEDKIQTSIWSAGPLIKNLLYTISATYGNSDNSLYFGVDPGLIFVKQLKNSWKLSAATNLDYSQYTSSYTLGGITVTEKTNTFLMHTSLALLNEKYSFGLAAENIPIGKNPYDYPLSVTFYADLILSNAIKTYSVNPSLYVNISQYPFISFNINTLLSNSILVGGGIKNNFMLSPFYYYLDFWFQGGFKFKKYFYFYLRINDILWTNPLNLYPPGLDVAVKFNIYKSNNAIPRYF